MRENSPEVLPPFPSTVIPPKQKQKRKLTPVSPVLREAARHIQKYGFTSDLGSAHAPACFMGSIETALESAKGFYDEREFDLVVNYLGKKMFGSDARNQYFCDDFYLEKNGWNTKDAVAALTIAADIAECEGR